MDGTTAQLGHNSSGLLRVEDGLEELMEFEWSEHRQLGVTLCGRIDDFGSVNETNSAQATNLLAEAKALKAEIEADRVEAKKPYLDGGKVVDAVAKDILSDVLFGIQSLEADLGQHLKAVAEARRQVLEREAAEAKAAADRAQAERLKLEQEASAAATDQRKAERAAAIYQAQADRAAKKAQADAREMNRVSTAAGTASAAESWTFELIEPDLVPRKFCKPDPALIRKAVKAGNRDIPGVKIYAKVSVTSRSR